MFLIPLLMMAATTPVSPVSETPPPVDPIERYSCYADKNRSDDERAACFIEFCVQDEQGCINNFRVYHDVGIPFSMRLAIEANAQVRRLAAAHVDHRRWPALAAEVCATPILASEVSLQRRCDRLAYEERVRWGGIGIGLSAVALSIVLSGGLATGAMALGSISSFALLGGLLGGVTGVVAGTALATLAVYGFYHAVNTLVPKNVPPSELVNYEYVGMGLALLLYGGSPIIFSTIVVATIVNSTVTGIFLPIAFEAFGPQVAWVPFALGGAVLATSLAGLGIAATKFYVHSETE